MLKIKRLRFGTRLGCGFRFLRWISGRLYIMVITITFSSWPGRTSFASWAIRIDGSWIGSYTSRLWRLPASIGNPSVTMISSRSIREFSGGARGALHSLRSFTVVRRRKTRCFAPELFSTWSVYVSLGSRQSFLPNLWISSETGWGNGDERR